jgi:thioredoxin-related protein
MRNTFASVLSLALLILLSSSSPAETARRIAGRQQGLAGRQQGLFKHATVEQAWKTAVTTKKPLLVMFTSDGCLYCTKMMKETYQNPAIERMLLQNTETVMAHSRDYQGLVKKMGIRGYPSTVLISPEGEVLDFMEGYVEAKVFAKRVYPLLQKHRTAQLTNASSSVAVNSPQSK